MRGVSRRVWLRGAAALALPVIGALPVTARAQNHRFAPPSGPMLYTRRLERSLADGAKLTVSRSFAVRIEPAGGGYRVTGEQVGVEVEAPEKLASFARIERERTELGLFPLTLDARGRILGDEPAPIDTRIEGAVREAVAMIEQRPRPPAERAELLRFVEAVHLSAGTLVSELPLDLFAPSPEPRRESGNVALPGGETGAVSVMFTAIVDPANGLMREARREVVTEFGGESRLTVESWQLEPLAP